MSKNFEMGLIDDPESIVKATQHAMITSMQNIVEGIKKDFGGQGLTWEQIEFIFNTYKNKTPTIINQEHDV